MAGRANMKMGSNAKGGNSGKEFKGGASKGGEPAPSGSGEKGKASAGMKGEKPAQKGPMSKMKKG